MKLHGKAKAAFLAKMAAGRKRRAAGGRKRPRPRRSAKFERCVMAVKKGSKKRGAVKVNPWAVCGASVGRDPAKAPSGPSSGFGREKSPADFRARIAWEKWAAKKARQQGHEAVAQGHDLARAAYEEQLHKRSHGHAKRDVSKDYVLMYGRGAVSRPFALRKMAIHEAEALSRPGSYGGEVTVVERSGYGTVEVGRARSGRFSTGGKGQFAHAHAGRDPGSVPPPSGVRKHHAPEPEYRTWDADELVLYIDNDYTLYQQKDRFLQNAYRKMKKGTYNPTLAVKLWQYYVDHGAKAYAKEFGGAWNKLFPKAERVKAAHHFAKREAMMLHNGEYPKYPRLS